MKKIVEGKIELEITTELKKDEFYNPAMSIVRDLNILVTSSLKSENSKYLDLLSSIGANALRIKKEVEIEVVANDISKNAIERLKKNAKNNKIEIEILNEDAKNLKIDEKFDFIDIDPFGSPIKFLPYIIKFLKKGTILSLTATDTSTLFGLKELTCLRRYGIKCSKTDFYRELGIRNLITATIFLFSKFNILSIPIFGYSEKHFVKVYFKIDKGKTKVNNYLEKNINFLSYCKNCLNREIGIKEFCNCGSKFTHFFPYFISEYVDKELLEKMEKELENRDYLPNYKKIKKIINMLKNENLKIPWYFDLHEIARKNKLQCIKKEKIIERLKKRYYASECFLESKAIRTEANIYEILSEIKNIMGP